MSLSTEAVEIIKEESEILNTVLSSLKDQIFSSTRRLGHEEVRSRALTSQLVATRREEDRAMLASDEAVSHAIKDRKAEEINLLQKMIQKPYFARIVLREEVAGKTQDFEYKIGFSANPDCRIIDWRKAPISKLYYEYKEGDEYCEEIQGRERSGKVLVRRTVEIERESLKRVSCRHGSFVYQGEQWIALGNGPTAAASGSATGHLPQIIGLITPEQFRTITEDADTAVLIQGIAGSGKTTIALHRLAWLLDKDNLGVAPSRTGVIVLNNALKAYIKDTLPSMNVEGVPVLTYREWVLETISHFIGESPIQRPAELLPTSLERVKKSMALLLVLENNAVEQRQKMQARLRAMAAAAPADSGEDVGHLRAIVRESRPIGAILKEILSITAVTPWLIEQLPELQRMHAAAGDFKGDILAALSRPQQLIERDDTRLLDRDLIERARAWTHTNYENGRLDHTDDALLLRLYQLKYGGAVFKDGHRGHYEHLVADEVQDMSPVQLATIIGAVPDTSHLTLVGDTAQKIDPSSVFPGWDKLRRHWNFREGMSRYISLEVSHRSTLPIMQLADHVQGRQVVKKGRPGRVPIWFKCYGQNKGIGAAINWLSTAIERFPLALTAVLCRDAAEAKHVLSLLRPTFGPTVRIGDDFSFSFAEGIVVTDVTQVKGLEFFNVVIWNPTRATYPQDEHARNLLYVAITRAQENLCICTWNRPSGLLPPINSRLVRGMEIGVEEDAA